MNHDVVEFWEEKYSNGHSQKYVWDELVSFYFSTLCKNKKIEPLEILEVGCGTGGNLNFFAEQGEIVTGIDASNSAISAAKSFFDKKQKVGNFVTGDFCDLPFNDDTFDVVIDRGALTCVKKRKVLN